MWIQLDDNIYAQENEQNLKVVNLNDLQTSVSNFQSDLDSLVPLEYPDGANDSMKEAIDEWNAKLTGKRLQIEWKINDLTKLISEITGG